MSFASMSVNYMRPFVGLELIIFSMMSEILETARQKQVRNSSGFSIALFLYYTLTGAYQRERKPVEKSTTRCVQAQTSRRLGRLRQSTKGEVPFLYRNKLLEDKARIYSTKE